MPTIYTIGTTKKSFERFIHLFQKAGVDAVIDVRLRNTSQLAGFSKRDDLAFLLRQGVDFEYEHHPELAPTPQIMDAHRENSDWDAYESHFVPLLREREIEKIGQAILERHPVPCLLCAEPTAQQCHRRLVAEYWATHLPGLTVIHL